jgi:hypothetical protein
VSPGSSPPSPRRSGRLAYLRHHLGFGLPHPSPRSRPRCPGRPALDAGGALHPRLHPDVRPPAAYTDALKRRQLADFGYADRDPTHSEEDHLVPLSIGGAPRDERNLWPQPWPEARDKDREEDASHVGVCTHRMSLAEAQRKILADWGPG